MKFTIKDFFSKLDQIRSDCLGPIFFSPGDSDTKGLLNFINLDKIHNTRNYWLGPIFFSPGVTQKDCLSCFI